MLKLTKQMKADIRKLKEDDLIVCEACGSEKISEKMWVDSNSYISIDGESYFKYIDGIDDTMYWCDKCNEESAPIHILEYEGDKDVNE